MKTKWYLFFLTVITITIILFNLLDFENEAGHSIGVLMIGEGRYEKYTGLQEGLYSLGYIPEDLQFVVKSANDDLQQLQTQIDDLLKEQLDLIVTMGGIETIQLKEKLQEKGLNIPVVFAGVAAPKEIGVIEDYKAPGGNFTGINNYHTSLSGKRLEMFQDLVPTLERVFAIYDETVEISVLSLEKAVEAGKYLSIDVIPCNAANPQYLKSIESLLGENDALYIVPSYRIETLTDEIVTFSRKHRLPVMGIYEHEVERGYLSSYGTSFFDQGFQAARFVSSIIQGNSPSELPVELPDTMRFLVNRDIMDELNLQWESDLKHIAEFIESKKEVSAQ